MKARIVLNVGGNSKDIPLPPEYAGWEHALLDIDRQSNPDILCDARELHRLPGARFDSVYCSHNLEHYHHHEVEGVLGGFLHVLKDDGFLSVRVPDLISVMRLLVERNLDIEDVLYQSSAGPITVRDVIYGFAPEIQRSGNEFFAHKTGFSEESLTATLNAAGFPWTFSKCGNYEVAIYAFKNKPTAYAENLLGLPRFDMAGRGSQVQFTLDGNVRKSVEGTGTSKSQTQLPCSGLNSVRRLHIGGKQISAGWEILNINPAFYVDHIGNANDLSQFADGTFAEIYASHVVEHFDYRDELKNTLNEWRRVLEPGGRVMISVPDLDILANLLVADGSLSCDDRFFVMRMMFGAHSDQHDYHVVGLNEEFLSRFLYESGYVNIRRVEEFGLFDDTSSMVFGGVGISLNMIAEKPVQLELVNRLTRDGVTTGQEPMPGLGEACLPARFKMDAITLMTAAGISISVPADLNCLTTYVLLEQEQWFEREIEFLSHWLRPGMNAIDVGANVGVYSLSIAKAVGVEGLVFAIEPTRSARSYLEIGCRLNQLDNLRTLSCALSDAEKEGGLGEEPSSELNSLGEGIAVSGDAERVRVSTLDIQALELHWPSIDFVKIDAEGQEARIVVGGRGVFSRHSPLVMYGILEGGKQRDSARWAFEALGYSTYRLLGDATCLVPVTSDELFDSYELNLFAAKQDRAASLAELGLLVLGSVGHSLTKAERLASLDGVLAQPYAREFEFSIDDVANCPFGDAFVAYAAYRNPDLPAARRYAALRAAFDALQGYCQETETPASLSTFSRVALDLGYRTLAVDALRRLTLLSGVELDQPFYPPCARFEMLSPRGLESEWFVAAANEEFELTRTRSSCFQDKDLARLQWLCAGPFSSAAIYRRLILKAAKQGQDLKELLRYAKSGQWHQNPTYWTETGIRDLLALR